MASHDEPDQPELPEAGRADAQADRQGGLRRRRVPGQGAEARSRGPAHHGSRRPGGSRDPYTDPAVVRWVVGHVLHDGNQLSRAADARVERRLSEALHDNADALLSAWSTVLVRHAQALADAVTAGVQDLDNTRTLRVARQREAWAAAASAADAFVPRATASVG